MPSIVVTIISFILIIGLVIFIHEFGHFIVAKKNNVGVVEFSIGFGPKIFSWVKNGTRYSVKWIPFGGYCMMLGDESMMPDGSGDDIVNDEEKAFSKKPLLVRAAVILAGPVFNFLLALLFAFLLAAFVGTTTSEVGGIAKGYPAEEAGLKKGDIITKLDHTSVHMFKDITLYMTMHEGEEISVTYKRNGEKLVTTLVPKYSEEDGRYLIGINATERRKLNVGEVFEYGWYDFAYNTGVVIKSLGMLFTGKASLNDLSGPVGMAGVVNEIVEDVKQDTEGESFFTRLYYLLMNLMSFTLLISANLGIMNLLPIPGLDGGKLLLFLVEGISGKPLNKKAEMIVTLIGVGLLILLMVVVFFNDIRKVFFHV
ncbi:MAG: site-2 protease family protein [Lachnospiraceae bacterium]|nr:site-2 protease family protein [Lachnospiraceae bacterium]